MIRLLLLTLLLPASLHASREAPHEIRPIRFEGVVITVPHFGFEVGTNPKETQNGGFVQAHDSKTGKLLWSVKLYQTRYDPKLEQDVQDVFISEVKLDRTFRVLLIRDEKDRVFTVFLDSHAVTQIKK